MRIGKSLLAVATNTNSSPDELLHPCLSSRSSAAKNAPKQGDNLTRMLLGCVVLYFITQLPAVTLNTLDHFSRDCCTDWQPFVGTVALVNYSVNFFVYMGMSAKFRRTTVELCRRGHLYGTFRSRLGSSEYRGGSASRTRTSSMFSVSWKRDGPEGGHVALLRDMDAAVPMRLSRDQRSRSLVLTLRRVSVLAHFRLWLQRKSV